jgi:N-acetylneuraminic acid mutarotase
MSILMNSPLSAASAVCASARAGTVVTAMLPPVPDRIGYAGAFAGVTGHQLLAGGGANFPDGVMPWNGGKKVWHDTLHALDLSAPDAGWKIIGQLPQPGGYGVSLSTREGVVLIGGGDAVRHFRDVWRLTLAADGNPVFGKLPDLPTALAQMSGALVGRRIHLCGGIEKAEATAATNAHWMLDLDALDKDWQKLPELPAAGRILATAAALDDGFYFMAGCSLAPDAAGKPLRTLLRDAWKFSEGRWSRIADLPRVLVASGSPAPVAGDSILLVSGDDGSQVGLASPDDHTGFSREVLRYDAGPDRWSSAGELGVPPPVTAAVTPWKDEFIFFNGEVKPGVRTPQVFAFDPSTCLPAHG